MVLRLQSTWSAKDIFHEFALDFARKVNDMSGGDLRIDVLAAGAVVPAFGLIDAVSKGTLDAGHGVLSYWFDRHPALALWGSGPAWGMDANRLLSWHRYGGGQALLEEIYDSLKLDVRSFLYGPMPAQPLGWFRKPVSKSADLKGLRYRTVGLSMELFTRLGATVVPLPADRIVEAMERGQLDAAEFNNASSDRALGFADVSKVCMLRSLHQTSEQFELVFNRKRYDALPERLRTIIRYAVEAASADMSWKATDRYASDYLELQKAGVKFYATPTAILQDQLKIWDEILAHQEAVNPMFARVAKSMKAFAERTGKWAGDTEVDYRMVHAHYFAQRPLGAGGKG